MSINLDVLQKREDWFDVDLLPRGAGWQVVLRIDGTYFREADAKRLCKWWAKQLHVPCAPLVRKRPNK